MKNIINPYRFGGSVDLSNPAFVYPLQTLPNKDGSSAMNIAFRAGSEFNWGDMYKGYRAPSIDYNNDLYGGCFNFGDRAYLKSYYTNNEAGKRNWDFSDSPGFTISVWVRPTSTAYNDGTTETSRYVLVDNGMKWPQQGWFLAIGIWQQDDNRADFYLRDENGAVVGARSTTEIPLHTWTHIAASFDNITKTAKIYINGILERTSTNPSFSSYKTTDSSSRCGIGCYGISTNGKHNFRNGRMQFLYMWSRVLNDASIKHIYDYEVAGNGGALADDLPLPYAADNGYIEAIYAPHLGIYEPQTDDSPLSRDHSIMWAGRCLSRDHSWGRTAYINRGYSNDIVTSVMGHFKDDNALWYGGRGDWDRLWNGVLPTGVNRVFAKRLQTGAGSYSRYLLSHRQHIKNNSAPWRCDLLPSGARDVTIVQNGGSWVHTDLAVVLSRPATYYILQFIAYAAYKFKYQLSW